MGSFSTTQTRLSAISEVGVRLVRTLLCPLWPGELDVYRNSPVAYFDRMTTFLDLCAASGISILANLLWRHATWSDPLDVITLETTGSTGRALIRAYVTDAVSRFYGHPAIAAWEVGNEWDLYRDSVTSLPSASVSDGTKASYSSPNDVLSSTAINGIYADAITAIRAYDSNRVIIAGTACAYGNVALATWKTTMAEDSTGMDAYSRHMYPGVSGITGTPNTGIFGDNDSSAFYGLRHLARKGEADGNPVIVGEFGCPKNWAYGDRLDVITRQVNSIVSSKIPLAFLWNFPDGPSGQYDILDLMPFIREWNALMKSGVYSTVNPQGSVSSSDAGYFVGKI